MHRNKRNRISSEGFDEYDRTMSQIGNYVVRNVKVFLHREKFLDVKRIKATTW